MSCSYYERGETTIPLIKWALFPRFLIRLSDQKRQLVKKFHTLFITLMLKFDPFMPLFTIPVVGPSLSALKNPLIEPPWIKRLTVF